MTRLRRTAGIASAAALTFALAACGGGSEYCSTIEDLENDIDVESLSGTELPDTETLTQIQEAFSEVADVAPEDVQQSWTNVADMFQVLIDADGDLTSIDPAEIENFANVQDDLTALETSVQDECDIELSS